MAVRKNTKLHRGGIPHDPGFNFQSQFEKIERERKRKKKKKKPTVPKSRSRRIG